MTQKDVYESRLVWYQLWAEKVNHTKLQSLMSAWITHVYLMVTIAVGLLGVGFILYGLFLAPQQSDLTCYVVGLALLWFASWIAPGKYEETQMRSDLELVIRNPGQPWKRVTGAWSSRWFTWIRCGLMLEYDVRLRIDNQTVTDICLVRQEDAPTRLHLVRANDIVWEVAFDGDPVWETDEIQALADMLWAMAGYTEPRTTEQRQIVG